MHTIINALSSESRHRSAATAASPAGFRKPNYDCREQPDAVKLVVYVPGVEAAGIAIEARGPDLVITARKNHFVRVNWQSLHLEAAQRDYQLRLRLGHGLNYPSLHAEIHQGVLTVVLPKLEAAELDHRARRVA